MMKPQFACVFILTSLVAGCGSDSFDSPVDAGALNGLGGSITTGGRSQGGSAGKSSTAVAGTGQSGSSNGGVTASTGVGGNNATGGMTEVGGSAATGGGAASGGTLAQGGSVSAGGALPTGGAVSTGGALAAGGTVSAGGALPTGGAVSTGGALATGGAVSAGGALATGGAVSTGGALPTGGAVSTGGALATGGAVSTGGALATGGTCATTYYRDADGDTWGGTETSCTSGTGWVTRTGDCNDSNANVFPDQSNTFALPYTATNGTQSFDYNCDSVETAAGGTQISTGECATAGLGNACVGDGYLPVEPVRVGENLNQACGSMRYLVCARVQQVCVGVISTDGTYEAVRCR